MSFTVESDNLREQGKEWAKRATSAGTVRADISPAVGQGGDFGVLAGDAGVKEAYNYWTSLMDNALQDCAYSATYLDSSLTSAANYYDASDATAVVSAKTLDGQLEATGYQPLPEKPVE